MPVQMDMDMHMFGVMYAPTDRVTLMAMTNYVRKDMDHVTYMGGAGTTVLGTFTTERSGLGDTRITGLLRLLDSKRHRIRAVLGVGASYSGFGRTWTWGGQWRSTYRIRGQ